ASSRTRADGLRPVSAAAAPIVMRRSGFDIKATLTTTLDEQDSLPQEVRHGRAGPDRLHAHPGGPGGPAPALAAADGAGPYRADRDSGRPAPVLPPRGAGRTAGAGRRRGGVLRVGGLDGRAGRRGGGARRPGRGRRRGHGPASHVRRGGCSGRLLTALLTTGHQ